MTSDKSVIDYLTADPRMLSALVMVLNGFGDLVAPDHLSWLREHDLVHPTGHATALGRAIGSPMLQQRAWLAYLHSDERGRIRDYLTDDELATLRALVTGKGVIDDDHLGRLGIMGLITNGNRATVLGWMVDRVV